MQKLKVGDKILWKGGGKPEAIYAVPWHKPITGTLMEEPTDSSNLITFKADSYDPDFERWASDNYARIPRDNVRLILHTVEFTLDIDH